MERLYKSLWVAETGGSSKIGAKLLQWARSIVAKAETA